MLEKNYVKLKNKKICKVREKSVKVKTARKKLCEVKKKKSVKFEKNSGE